MVNKKHGKGGADQVWQTPPFTVLILPLLQTAGALAYFAMQPLSFLLKNLPTPHLPGEPLVTWALASAELLVTTEPTEIDAVNANAAMSASFTMLIRVSLELRNVIAFSSASQA
jgi:hypothetical protein